MVRTVRALAGRARSLGTVHFPRSAVTIGRPALGRGAILTIGPAGGVLTMLAHAVLAVVRATCRRRPALRPFVDVLPALPARTPLRALVRTA
ncbi:MAG: hypothetical protein WA962_06615 [Ornithinimicrobium sp.]